MIIRQYKNKDCDIVSKLFYETVHSVNAKDYTVEQLSVWANNADSLKIRHDDLLNQNTLIAEMNGVIIGFGSIDKSGCLDLLFVHKDYQKQGVATALCNELEKDLYMKKMRLDDIYPTAYHLPHSDKRFRKKREKTLAATRHPPHYFQNCS